MTETCIVFQIDFCGGVGARPEPNYGRALYMAATQLYTTVASLGCDYGAFV